MLREDKQTNNKKTRIPNAPCSRFIRMFLRTLDRASALPRPKCSDMPSAAWAAAGRVRCFQLSSLPALTRRDPQRCRPACERVVCCVLSVAFGRGSVRRAITNRDAVMTIQFSLFADNSGCVCVCVLFRFPLIHVLTIDFPCTRFDSRNEIDTVDYIIIIYRLYGSRAGGRAAKCAFTVTTTTIASRAVRPMGSGCVFLLFERREWVSA